MKSVVVGTAGHIDHGKSALVQALTGTDPDRLKEEKARGITIDLGFAHQAIGDLNVAFVDVPGHERFVKNMLAGVGGVDLVVLVVAADESVMPQTREHFDICRLLRVPAGLVALTKSDLADADMLEIARLEVQELVAGSFLDGAPIVPVSSRTGAGLDEFRSALGAAAAGVRGRTVDATARLPIDRVFSMKGFGTVVTGTLVSGRVAADDELIVTPGERRVKVRGVQVHGAKQLEAFAGQRAAVNLGGVEVDEIARGQSLVASGAFEETRVADAIVEVLPGAKALQHGARVRFHQGTAEILGRVAVIGPAGEVDRDRAAGAAKGEVRPSVAAGGRAFVRLRLERPAILARGDRYILRAYSPAITIAGGHILDPKPPRAGIRSTGAVERCRRLDFTPEAEAERRTADLRAATVMTEDAGRVGLSTAALVTRVGVDPGSVEAAIGALVATGAAVRAGETLVSAPVFDALKASIVALLAEHHRKQPLSEGVPREEARERLFARGSSAVFERALADLAATAGVSVRERLALATHRVELSPDEARARDAIARVLQTAGLTPPDAAALAAEAGASAAVVERMLKLLQRQKVVAKVDTLWFHDEALKRLKADVAALKVSGAAARIDVSTFKERFGVTRKFAIPLLEYLDRERITRRVGDARVLL
ncbi:MAG TPA: selenocysteine-specific translation elongation factor [Vicinamibacterales bacterium]|nr:selenocysteine-specific translation elongation factor [Vicinamibacterales bacterium]